MSRPVLLRLVGSALALAVMAGVMLWHVLVADLPTLDRLTEARLTSTTKILARDGRLLYEIADPAGQGRHTTVPLADIPLVVQQATIATEDASFYVNPGVDVWGIARAVWINLTGGEVLAGGSTITQQVARNMLLDPQERAQRTLTRKLRESILAWRLAQAYSKDQILELYLNQSYYGHLAYGVEAAAQTFFGKSARDLDLAEAALIAGLTQAPALYDPLLYPEAAQARQAVVLDLMTRAGYITLEEADQARREPLQWATAPFPIRAPHFVFMVWNQLERRYGPEVLYSGLVVTTTLDLDLTDRATAIVRRHLNDLRNNPEGRQHNATNAALVALDPRTGQLLALVGSPNYFQADISGAVNMALAPRQPGSALKPFVYALALDPARCPRRTAPTSADRVPLTACPWTAATPILDVRTAFVTAEGFSYVPMNYDRAFHGPVSVREALAGSLNLPAVVALEHVGLNEMLTFANQLGLTTLTRADRVGLSLALGGGEVRLLDLTAAYATLATGGLRAEPAIILEVRDSSGALIDQWRPLPPNRVLAAPVAALITDILSDNAARAPTFGFNSALQIGRPAAVKTGTTTDYRDNWTLGYTPDLAVGVWVGNADQSPMLNLGGVAGAGPIWHELMRLALQGKPVTAWARPPELTQAVVCVPSGQLPTPACQRTRAEWFITGTVPTQPDTWYQPVTLDVRTDTLAAPDTPPDLTRAAIVLVLPPAAREWAGQRGLPYTRLQMASASPTAPLVITAPDPGTVYKISPRLPLASQRVPFRVHSQVSLARLTLFLNDAPLVELDPAAREWLWPLTPGVYTLTAQARTADGQTLTAAPITFRVEP